MLNDNIITSAGITAGIGIGMSLHLVSKLHSLALAEKRHCKWTSIGVKRMTSAH